MSGICGVFNLNSLPATPEMIASMTDALAHRGPDGRGFWLGGGGSVALGHRALHSTPESRREAQPIVREAAGLTLVADARIDNREDLIGALGLSRAAAPTDGELILAAYERWGEGCAERLIGDFAFAIWNERARSLFCARDVMGVKPFYYVADPRRFAFASEIKALRQVPGIDVTIDPEQVALFLGWNHDDRERTLYREVRRLPAAHTLIVTPEAVTLRRYWSAENARDVRLGSDAEYVEAFREIFANAVSVRLRAGHAVGATLSGGLDSSSVVCTARQLRGSDAPPLATFSLIFPDLPEADLRLIDERAYVDAVVRAGGVDPHFVRGDRVSPLSEVERIVWHLDEPFSMPNLYLHWAMFDAARGAGVRVLLDGFDGDSAVSHGFGYLTGLTRAGDYRALANEINAFCQLHQRAPAQALDAYVLPHLDDLAREGRLAAWWRSANRLSDSFGISRRGLARRHALSALVPEVVRAHRARRRPLSPEHTFLRPELARLLRDRELDAARAAHRRATPSEREAHVEGISQPSYQLTLEVADKCAAAFGVEPRYPFFDRRLIEFCIGVPEAQKFGGGWPRLLFRRAMEGILPAEVQWRTTKANLAPNFRRQFRSVDIGRHVLGRSEASSYLRVDRLREMQAAYQNAARSEKMNLESLALFRAATLDTWLANHSNGGRQESTDIRAMSPVAA